MKPVTLKVRSRSRYAVQTTPTDDGKGELIVIVDAKRPKRMSEIAFCRSVTMARKITRLLNKEPPCSKS